MHLSQALPLQNLHSLRWLAALLRCRMQTVCGLRTALQYQHGQLRMRMTLWDAVPSSAPAKTVAAQLPAPPIPDASPARQQPAATAGEVLRCRLAQHGPCNVS